MIWPLNGQCNIWILWAGGDVSAQDAMFTDSNSQAEKQDPYAMS